MPCRLAESIGRRRIGKDGAAITVAQRKVEVPRLAGQLLRQLRHEAHRLAVTGKIGAGKILEQHRIVRRLDALFMIERRLKAAGTEFGVDGIELDAHGFHRRFKAGQKLAVKRRRLEGIGPVSLRKMREIAILLRSHALRRLIEDEELELKGGMHIEAEFGSLFDLRKADIARRAAAEFAVEIRDTQRHVLGEGIFADRRRVEPGRPVDERSVAIGAFSNIPEIEHLAERIAVLAELHRLFGGDKLVTEFAFRIHHADMD